MKSQMAMLQRARENNSEPLFTIRAQDIHSLNTLEYYQGLIDKDKNIDDQFKKDLYIIISDFKVWRQKNHTKIKTPD